LKQPILELAVEFFFNPSSLLFRGWLVFILGNLIPVFPCWDYVCFYRLLVFLVLRERLIEVSFMDSITGGLHP
jgi:hypothetical protein